MLLSNTLLTKPYIRRPTYEVTIISATNAIRQILSMKDVSKAHTTELLSVMIWKISEANGKWNVRYFSADVLSNSAQKIQHEHVVTRKQIINQLMTEPQKMSEILSQVTACLVTESEHRQLAQHDAESGWERYKAAGIRVFDRDTKDWLW